VAKSGSKRLAPCVNRRLTIRRTRTRASKSPAPVGSHVRPRVMSCFHIIERCSYEQDRLTVNVAELLSGEPDEYIGLPLIVRNDSKRYSVSFKDVGRIEIEPEPIVPPSDLGVKETPFLFREPESALLIENRWSATMFNFGRRFAQEEELKHYIVLGENFVIHVLTLTAPEIITLPYAA
jgi:hypothetical protein